MTIKKQNYHKLIKKPLKDNIKIGKTTKSRPFIKSMIETHINSGSIRDTKLQHNYSKKTPKYHKDRKNDHISTIIYTVKDRNTH